jgi:hypothetical protein
MDSTGKSAQSQHHHIEVGRIASLARQDSSKPSSRTPQRSNKQMSKLPNKTFAENGHEKSPN